MIMNVDNESNQKRFNPEGGIGLFKINYEMDLKGSSDNPQYSAGIIAYSNEQAVKTLVNFCKNKVKGFKGLKVQELAFEGLCHEISDEVKNVILNGAVKEGKVVASKDHQKVLEELEAKMKAKKSIVKKSKE
jgi:uncharacterized protein YaeQ